MKSAKLLDELEQKLAERKVLLDAVIELSTALKQNPPPLDCLGYGALKIDSRALDAINTIHELAD